MWRAVILTFIVQTASNEQCKDIECLLANQAKLEARLAEMEGIVERGTGTASRRLAIFNEEELAAVAEQISMVSLGGPTGRVPLQHILKDLVKKLGDLSTCLDYMWLLLAGALVAFMQGGFAVIESGSVGVKNAGTVLLKNVMDGCIGTVVWYFIGYGLAYGISENPNTFVGTQNFAGQGFMETDADGSVIGTSHLKDWFFQWAFCATTATIVSGGVAGRIRLLPYFTYASVMTGLIYPFIVYWTWSGKGFLTEQGYSDFAGSGIVHLPGGIGALVGAIMVGPRDGRWSSGPGRFDAHNMGFVVLGTFMLWFGWYGFNCGSTLAFSDVGTAMVASLVAVNTTIAAATGGCTVFLARFAVQRKYDLPGSCNGILVGLVAVCAGCDVYTPGTTFVVGILGGLAHEVGHYTVQRLRIDDPLDAFAVHGCGGLIGVLLRPLLDHQGANGKMFGVHCLAIVCIAAWTAVISAIVFGIFKALGMLSLSAEEQSIGTDVTELGQTMYGTATMETSDVTKEETETNCEGKNIDAVKAADDILYELSV